MPEQEYYTRLTDPGRAKLAAAMADDSPLGISEAALGDGGGASYDPAPDQTALVGEWHRRPVNRITVDPYNPHWVVVEVVVPMAVGGHYVREVGLIDSDGTLIAIAKFPPTYKPTLIAGTGSDLIIRVILEVANAESVELLIDPAVVTASRQYVDEQVLGQAQLTEAMVSDRFDDLGPAAQYDIGTVPGLLPLIGALGAGITKAIVVDYGMSAANLPDGVTRLSAGEFDWLPPAHVSRAFALVIGGGGGGRARRDSRFCGGGGGGGIEFGPIAVTPGQPVAILVGNGGRGGAHRDGTPASGAYSGGTSQVGGLAATGGRGGGGHGTGGAGGDGVGGWLSASLGPGQPGLVPIARPNNDHANGIGGNGGGPGGVGCHYLLSTDEYRQKATNARGPGGGGGGGPTAAMNRAGDGGHGRVVIFY